MNALKYSEILRTNNELGKALQGTPYRVKIVSNLVTHQLNEILEYSLRSRSISAQAESGQYDNIVQECANASNFQLLVIFWEVVNLVEGFYSKVERMRKQEIDALLDKVEQEICFVFKSLASTQLVLLNRFNSQAFSPLSLEFSALDAVAQRLNRYLEDHCPGNVRLIDLDQVMLCTSLERAIDFRSFYSSKSLYSVEFYKAYAEYVAPLILSATGKSINKTANMTCTSNNLLKPRTPWGN